MKKFLVYYFNGLVTTNVLLFATDEKNAEEIFRTEFEKDELFLNGNCIGGQCEFVKAVKL